MKVDVSENLRVPFLLAPDFPVLGIMFNANISDNFLGLGYTMLVSANVSSVQQQENLQLFDPYFLVLVGRYEFMAIPLDNLSKMNINEVALWPLVAIWTKEMTSVWGDYLRKYRSFQY